MKSLFVLLMVVGVALPRAQGQGCQDGFVGLSGKCLKVEIAAGPVFSGKFSIQWKVARERCQALGADLVVLDDPDLLIHLTDYIHETVSSTGEYYYWVGGRTVNGEWRWVNDHRINLNSNTWVPSYPKVTQEEAFLVLVPADGAHGRLYLNQGTEISDAPAFICEHP